MGYAVIPEVCTLCKREPLIESKGVSYAIKVISSHHALWLCQEHYEEELK